MMTIRWRECASIALLVLASCNRASLPVPLTAEDLRVARQAMPLADVSLMLRSGYKEEAIIAEVRKKRVSAPPDAVAENSLIALGASPALIEALKAKENLLTENQRQAFDRFAIKRSQRVQQEAASRQEELAALQTENSERQRRANAVQQTVQNAQAADNKEKAYEQAWDTYTKQKEYLERRIASIQGNINRRRSSYGYRQDNLLELNQELDRLSDQLRNLPTPPLR